MSFPPDIWASRNTATLALASNYADKVRLLNDYNKDYFNDIDVLQARELASILIRFATQNNISHDNKEVWVKYV